MNEIIEKEKIIIEDMIYEVRGVQVMLSSDVAKIYQVETKVLNQTIKRNINRFPDRFCFQLNVKELDELSSRSQFVTLKIIHLFLHLLIENKIRLEIDLCFFL